MLKPQRNSTHYQSGSRKTENIRIWEPGISDILSCWFIFRWFVDYLAYCFGSKCSKNLFAIWTRFNINRAIDNNEIKAVVKYALRSHERVDACLFNPLKVNFLREGCGSDKICQSNLKLNYQFGTRPLNSDLFTPLPKLVSADLSPDNLYPNTHINVYAVVIMRPQMFTMMFDCLFFYLFPAFRLWWCVTVHSCKCLFSVHVETRMTCRCSPCRTRGWWCWRSPSPTCPLTRCTPRRTGTTLTLLSCSSPFQTLCRMPAPESHLRCVLQCCRGEVPSVWISAFCW